MHFSQSAVVGGTAHALRDALWPRPRNLSLTQFVARDEWKGIKFERSVDKFLKNQIWTWSWTPSATFLVFITSWRTSEFVIIKRSCDRHGHDMALSSLSKLQLLRSFLLFLIVLDIGVPTVLFLRLGSDKNIEDTIADQVCQTQKCLRLQAYSYHNIHLRWPQFT